MANTTLMALNSLAVTGTSVNVGTAVTSVNLQFTPDPNSGFSGTVFIEGSTAPSPGASDWFQMGAFVFTAHTTVVDLNMYFTNNPWIRARMPSNATLGSVAIYMAY